MPTVMGLGSLLSERADPEAAEPARRAIEICRASGEADQLRMALPTAAMICWQVGAYDEARAYVEEAMPLHDAGPRIAKVVLYSAAAGLALADGEAGGAAELASRADADGTELGVERELPLVRAISARALLALGDQAAAADRASASLEAALTISYDFPLALGLETAALVIGSAGAGTPEQRAALLLAAADLRERGDRPPPASMPAPDVPDRADRAAGRPGRGAAGAQAPGRPLNVTEALPRPAGLVLPVRPSPAPGGFRPCIVLQGCAPDPPSPSRRPPLSLSPSR